MEPTPKSLVLDLLSTLRGQAMPVRALVAAGEVFAISSESIRVALVRLLERGTIERNERGQYCFAPAAEAVQRHVVSWTRIEDRLQPWRGSWVGVHTGGLAGSERTQSRRRTRALRFLGLRELAKHLWLRPDNLRGGVDAVRSELQSLGLEPNAPVFGLTQLEPTAETRARELWDTASLRRDYTALRTTLERSAERLGRVSERDAMVESFLLGGQAIRQIVLDPLLPEPLIRAGELAQVIEAMRRYDRLGRACWKPFMTAHRAPHLRMPRRLQAAAGAFPA